MHQHLHIGRIGTKSMQDITTIVLTTNSLGNMNESAVPTYTSLIVLC